MQKRFFIIKLQRITCKAAKAINESISDKNKEEIDDIMARGEAKNKVSFYLKNQSNLESLQRAIGYVNEKGLEKDYKADIIINSGRANEALEKGKLFIPSSRLFKLLMKMKQDDMKESRDENKFKSSLYR